MLVMIVLCLIILLFRLVLTMVEIDEYLLVCRLKWWMWVYNAVALLLFEYMIGSFRRVFMVAWKLKFYYSCLVKLVVPFDEIMSRVLVGLGVLRLMVMIWVILILYRVSVSVITVVMVLSVFLGLLCTWLGILIILLIRNVLLMLSIVVLVLVLFMLRLMMMEVGDVGDIVDFG